MCTVVEVVASAASLLCTHVHLKQWEKVWVSWLAFLCLLVGVPPSHFHFRMCFSPQRRAMFQHLNFKKCSRTLSFLTFSLLNVLFATAAYNFSTSELQKVLPDRQFFNIFTSECAFRHSGVQFFDISTSKSTRSTSCFVHFHFKLCFSPQRRAIFDVSSHHLPPHPPL